jgi:hypothetical protein
MADRMLCLYDKDHKKKRVDARWLRLMIRFQAKNPSGWKSLVRAAIKQRQKRGTLECWKILVEKMQRKFDFGN